MFYSSLTVEIDGGVFLLGRVEIIKFNQLVMYIFQDDFIY